MVKNLWKGYTSEKSSKQTYSNSNTALFSRQQKASDGLVSYHYRHVFTTFYFQITNVYLNICSDFDFSRIKDDRKNFQTWKMKVTWYVNEIII